MKVKNRVLIPHKAVHCSGGTLRTLPLVCLSLLLVILASDVTGAGSLKGKVRKKVYHSPEKNFTVPVPSGPGMKISDDYIKQANAGAVSFHDDAGNLRAVHYMDVATSVWAARK